MLLAANEVLWQALIAGAVTVILAYFQHRSALRQEQIAEKKAEEVKDALVIATQKTTDKLATISKDAEVIVQGNDVADKKLDHITLLTNSTLTAANKRIDELESMVRALTAERNVVKKQDA